MAASTATDPEGLTVVVLETKDAVKGLIPFQTNSWNASVVGFIPVNAKF